MLCTNEPCYTTGRSLRANILYRNTATGCFPMYWIPLLKEYRNGFVSKNKGRNLLTLDMPAISQPEAPSLFACLPALIHLRFPRLSHLNHAFVHFFFLDSDRLHYLYNLLLIRKFRAPGKAAASRYGSWNRDNSSRRVLFLACFFHSHGICRGMECHYQF